MIGGGSQYLMDPIGVNHGILKIATWNIRGKNGKELANKMKEQK